MAPLETAEEMAHRCEREQRVTVCSARSASNIRWRLFASARCGYLNTVPLTRGLEEEVIYATPAKLAEMLRRDELDAALVSVVEVLLQRPLRHPGRHRHRVPGRGEERSAGAPQAAGGGDGDLLRHRVAHERELLKVLLAERGLKPEFKPLESYEAAKEKDFVLLIGDVALDFMLPPSPGPGTTSVPPKHEIFDLGTAWYELTNLPFVYAAWALRRGIENKALRRRLREAKAFGMETLDYLIDTRKEYDEDFRRDYLGWHIHYHLASDEKRGIAKFCELLQKHGFGPMYEPKFVS